MQTGKLQEQSQKGVRPFVLFGLDGDKKRESPNEEGLYVLVAQLDRVSNYGFEG